MTRFAHLHSGNVCPVATVNPCTRSLLTQEIAFGNIVRDGTRVRRAAPHAGSSSTIQQRSSPGRPNSNPSPIQALSGEQSPRFSPASCPMQRSPLALGNQWELAPAPEEVKNYFIAPRSNQCFASINPVTEEKLTEIAAADEVDVDKAEKLHAGPAITPGASCPGASGAIIFIGTPASSGSRRTNWRCSRRWRAASPSSKAAMWICRSCETLFPSRRPDG